MGIAITLQDGTTYVAGDVDYKFSIQSVAKPFTMALVMEDQGVDAVKQKIGVEPTGMPFNSIIAIELNEKPINPLVNAGAIAAVSMIDANSERARWNTILKGYEAFAGQDLDILKDVYKSEAETNYRNRAIANLLYNYDRLYSDPMEATTVYTKQGTVGVSARIPRHDDGGCLASHGVNPKTGVRVIREDFVDEVLAVMLMAGFYDEVGKWAFRAGLPAKTGVGGGIVAVVPGDILHCGLLTAAE